MLQSWQKCLDQRGNVGAILMDLSKAYDCLPHDLILAKLRAYGIGRKSLRLLNNYLKKRFQRVKIGSKLSDWLEILSGVPQGSILGPILFNIFINDLFLFLEETCVCNFADDNSIYACDIRLERVISRLSNDTKSVMSWFKINSLVANPDKFQTIFLGEHIDTPIQLDINGYQTSSFKCSKTLRGYN